MFDLPTKPPRYPVLSPTGDHNDYAPAKRMTDEAAWLGDMAMTTSSQSQPITDTVYREQILTSQDVFRRKRQAPNTLWREDRQVSPSSASVSSLRGRRRVKRERFARSVYRLLIQHLYDTTIKPRGWKWEDVIKDDPLLNPDLNKNKDICT